MSAATNASPEAPAAPFDADAIERDCARLSIAYARAIDFRAASGTATCTKDELSPNTAVPQPPSRPSSVGRSRPQARYPVQRLVQFAIPPCSGILLNPLSQLVEAIHATDGHNNA